MGARPALVRRAVAEAIGTFALVFAGCGAIVTDADRHGSLGVVGVGLVFFLVLLAAIGALGQVSGAHFNPGVSLSFFLTRRLPGSDLAADWSAEFLGATVAALLLLLETVLTAVLMLVIMSVATDTRAVVAPAAVAIAAAVGLAAIAFGPLIGASLNTARSFGPALASGHWEDFWIYVVGPLIGAPLGAFAYEYVRAEQPQLPTLSPTEEKSDGHRPVRLPA